MFTRIVAEQAVHGVGGAVDDSLAFIRPWGFDLADITVPVLLTYGLEDVSCPPGHGRWMAARIRTALVVGRDRRSPVAGSRGRHRPHLRLAPNRRPAAAMSVEVPVAKSPTPPLSGAVIWEAVHLVPFRCLAPKR